MKFLPQKEDMLEDNRLSETGWRWREQPCSGDKNRASEALVLESAALNITARPQKGTKRAYS